MQAKRERSVADVVVVDDDVTDLLLSTNTPLGVFVVVASAVFGTTAARLVIVAISKPYYVSTVLLPSS
jgi:hypothetical protein